MTEEASLQSETAERVPDQLITHTSVCENHSYEVIALEPGFAKVRFQTRLAEKIDKTSYIYEASIFSCANFAAIAAINEQQNHIISARVDFLNPIRVEDEEVIFEATASTNSSGKKEVQVAGFVKGIAVFESRFVTLKLDKKSILKEEPKT